MKCEVCTSCCIYWRYFPLSWISILRYWEQTWGTYGRSIRYNILIDLAHSKWAPKSRQHEHTSNINHLGISKTYLVIIRTTLYRGRTLSTANIKCESILVSRTRISMLCPSRLKVTLCLAICRLAPSSETKSVSAYHAVQTALAGNDVNLQFWEVLRGFKVSGKKWM